MIGESEEMNASEADTVAIGMASRATHLMPQKFTRLNRHTIEIATASTGNSGTYHC